jgi:hypothetical protein
VPEAVELGRNLLVHGHLRSVKSRSVAGEQP